MAVNYLFDAQITVFALLVYTDNVENQGCEAYDAFAKYAQFDSSIDRAISIRVFAFTK